MYYGCAYQAALAFSSGLAATNTIVSLLNSGDHLICEEDAYGGTHRLFSRVVKSHNVESTFVDFLNPENVERAIIPGKTKVHNIFLPPVFNIR